VFVDEAAEQIVAFDLRVGRFTRPVSRWPLRPASVLLRLGCPVGLTAVAAGTAAYMDARSARLAANEAIFRAGNELIERAVAGSSAEAPFLCECGDESCFERMTLTVQEYEAVRSHPARFFVVPGHEDLTAGEIVVESFDRYAVVEKQGEERELIERSSRQVS
jgi:hypothetical protein